MLSNAYVTNGEPDTSRGVSPVPREGVGDLPSNDGKAPLPYPTTFSVVRKSRIFSRIPNISAC